MEHASSLGSSQLSCSCIEHAVEACILHINVAYYILHITEDPVLHPLVIIVPILVSALCGLRWLMHFMMAPISSSFSLMSITTCGTCLDGSTSAPIPPQQLLFGAECDVHLKHSKNMKTDRAVDFLKLNVCKGGPAYLCS